MHYVNLGELVRYWGGPCDGMAVRAAVAGASVVRFACLPRHDTAGALVVLPLGSHERYEWCDLHQRYEWRGTMITGQVSR